MNRFRNILRLMMNLLFGFVMISLFIQCSGTKYLSENQVLYTGAEIKFITPEGVHGRKEILSNLENNLRPKPNFSLFGSRPLLWLHGVVKEPKKDKGFKYWLKYKVGNPPVLLSDVKPEYVSKSISAELFNVGFFNAQTDYKIKQKKKTAKIEYEARVSKPYQIREIVFPPDSTEITSIIDSVSDKTVLKKNDRFSFEIIKEEMQRIEKALKNEGYYYFSENNLIFEIDSTVGKKQVDIFLKLKENIPQQAVRRYEINNINIYPDYTFTKSNTADYTHHVEADSMNVYFLSDDKYINPKVISNAIVLDPGEKYSRINHTKSLNRLIGLGIFKFVDMRFEEDSADVGLNTKIYLSPLKRKSIRLQAELVSTSDNFLGPGLDITYSNRNIFGGAELLQISLQSSFETQINGQQNQPLNSLEVGLEGSLTIPRFVTPFNLRNTFRFVPQTKINLGGSFVDRVDYFRLNSTTFSYGFLWKESVFLQHEFYPLDINYVSVSNKGPLFIEFLETNPYLAHNYQDQFIIGGNYTFTYNSKLQENSKDKTHNFYVKGNVDVSGNLLYLLQSGVNGFENRNDNSYSVFGSPYAQYGKTSVDFRYFHRIDKRNQIASRLIAGVGVPYGNSTIMPYVKQFSAGGSSDIRAFRARTVGPGSFYNVNINKDNVYIDQTGDIKLEGSLEYRFDIFRDLFKGAVFTDAGNIWLVNNDSTRVGGKFEGSQFINEIAVGTGAGIRLVTQFFVLRFDVAFPIRKVQPLYPQDPDGNGKFDWVFDEIDFTDKNWRQENLIWNIAIGYPF